MKKGRRQAHPPPVELGRKERAGSVAATAGLGMVGFLETPLGKHLEQLRGIGSLSTASPQRHSASSRLTYDRASWSTGPASRGPRRPPFHKLSLQPPMSRNERWASLFRQIDRRKLIQTGRRPSVSWRPTTRARGRFPHHPFLLIEHLRGEHVASLYLTIVN